MLVESRRHSERRSPKPHVLVLLLALALCTLFELPSAHAQLGATFFGWRPLPVGSGPSRVVALLADPRSDSTLFLVAPSGGIWRSDNGGVTWSPQFDYAYSAQACSVALDSTAPDIMYAGTGDDQSPRPAQGVARSVDGGRNWLIGARFTNQPVCSVAVDPSKGSRVLAGSSEGLFLSNDSATTWRKVLSVPITSISFDGRGNIFAGELGKDSLGARNNVLARSTDGGLTWTSASLPVPPAAASSQTTWVTTVAKGNSLFLVISYSAFQSSTNSMDFYSSTDGGLTWTIAPAIGAALPPVSLVADASGNNLYVTGTNVLASQDQGVTWNPLTTSFTQFHAAVITGSSLLTGGEVVLERVPIADSGTSGQIALPIQQFLDVAIDSSGNPWAAGPGGLFSHVAAGIFLTGIGSIGAATNATSQNIFASANASTYHSTNLGAKFTSSVVIPVNELHAPYPPLLINPTNAATAFVAGQKLYRTTNSGTAWSLLAPIDTTSNNVVTALAISPAGGRTMYAASACLPEVTLTNCPAISIIWRSTNTGAAWTKMGTVLGVVTHLAGDPRQANTVYAAIGGFAGGPSQTAGYNQGDLVKSTDGGATWISVAANLPRVPINAIAIDPNSVPTATPPQPGGGGGIIIFPPGGGGLAALQQPAQTIYVGTDAGVFVTFNAGTQWTQMSSGLPLSPITQLLLQPAGTLSATTFGRGAYQAEVTGLSASLIANPLSANVILNQGASKAVSLSLANNAAISLSWQITSLDPWISTPVATGTLQPSGSASLTFQVSSTGLAVGTYLGRLQVTNGTLTQTVLVNLQVTTPPAAISIVSGNNQSSAPGNTLKPLIVSLVDTNGTPVPGAQVNFSVSSGSGTLTIRSATSDSAGSARTSLTLPSSPGTIQVTATSGSLTATFTATAVLVVPPVLDANSVVNGVTFSSGAPVSPGTILSIFGSNLASSAEQAASLPLTTSLQDTSVVVTTPDGDISLPLFYVSPLQINALLPYDMATGTYSLRVVSGSVPSASVPLSVAAYSPGIFTLSSNGQGIFLKPDGSLVNASNPATAGSIVTFFATGLGAVNPPLAAGAAGASAEPLNLTTVTPKVFFDGTQATVLYSGLAPGFAGLYQVNLRVPSGISSATNVSFSLSINGITSNRVFVPVAAASPAAPVQPSPPSGTPPPATPNQPVPEPSPAPTPQPTAPAVPRAGGTGPQVNPDGTITLPDGTVVTPPANNGNGTITLPDGTVVSVPPGGIPPGGLGTAPPGFGGQPAAP